MKILDGLIGKLREACAGLPDKRRRKNARYTMADIGMAAFSVFFIQSPSFLAHKQRLTETAGHGRSNCQTLFGISEIPCNNHIRALLDPVELEHFDKLFEAAVEAIEEKGGLAAFCQFVRHVPIAFDGTEYFRSAEIGCSNCSTRARAGGKHEYFHMHPARRRRCHEGQLARNHPHQCQG
jgi:hypothetical protein